MPIIKTVAPAEAQGQVKEVYDMFLGKFGMVPTPLIMMSASPDIQGLQIKAMGYFMGHKNLSPGLLALIRMMVAEEAGYDYCISLNREVLKAMGLMSDDQVAAVLADPDQAPVSDKDKVLLKLVLKVVQSPGEVTAADMDAARAMGWSDQDIFDASWHGVGMIASGILFKAFNMGEGASC